MIVGEADIDVRANTSNVEDELNKKLGTIGSRVGDRFGRLMGQRAGSTFASEAERGTARVARSGRLLADVFTSNSATALGPLQEVVNKIDLIGTTLENTRSRAGGALLGIGAAATGIGAFISTLASREEGALKRLSAAIDNTGSSLDQYRDRIDAAVRGGEHFGFSANQTLDALNLLTVGLHSPQKALDNLALAQDIAAERSISLANAADIVRQIYNGSPRALRQFGIAATEVADVQARLTDAQKTSATSLKAVSDAQQTYANKLAVYRDTLKPTLSQQIALKESHDKLMQATANNAAAQASLADAQKAVATQATLGDQKLKLVADRLRGEASASADTFTGRLKAMGARIEDTTTRLGSGLGHELILFGPAIAGVGFLIESGIVGKVGRAVGSLIGLGAQANVTAGEVAVASEEEDASLGTVVAAIERLTFALTGVGPAAAAAAGEVGVAATAMDGALATTTTEATTLGGVLRGVLGMAGTLGIVAAGVGVAVNEAVSTNRTIGQGKKAEQALRDELNSAKTNAELQAAIADATKQANAMGAFITPDGAVAIIPDAKKRNTAEAGARILDAVLQAKKNLAAGLADITDNPAQDAKDAAHATARGKMIGAAVSKGIASSKPQSLADFLKSIGAQEASAKADAAIKDLQDKAAQRTRDLGDQVTQGLRDQIDKVRGEVQALNSERDKILGFRDSVLSAAQSFTKLSGLIDDPSTSTAARITHSLSTRLLGLQTFARNLQQLAKRGLDKGVLAELAQGGPEQRALSSALVAGSDGQLKALNATERAVRAQQDAIAKVAVDTQFGGRPAQVDRRLAALNAQLDTLNKQVAAQPKLIAAAVEQARKNAAVSTKTSTRTAVPR